MGHEIITTQTESIACATHEAPRTLHGMLSHAYRVHAESVAVEDETTALSYGQLGSSARRFGRALRGLGASAGDRVLVLGNNSVDWVVSDHALCSAGLVRVGILPRLHPREVGEIAADVEPFAVIVDDSWLQKFGTEWVPPATRHIVSMSRGSTSACTPLTVAGLIDSARDEPFDEPSPLEPAWIMYTSGSTGKPKGVIATHGALAAVVRAGQKELSVLDGSDVVVHTAPISHFSGIIAMMAYNTGATNLLCEGFEVDAVIDLARERATVLPLVPTQIGMITEELERRKESGNPYGKLKLIPYAGSAIAPTTAERAQNCLGKIFMQFYASSEAPLPITVLRPDEHVAATGGRGLSRLASAGRAVPSVGVAIEGQGGGFAGADEVGEILLRGPQIMSGYWRRPLETQAAFTMDGWLRSGDVGYLDEDDFLYIVDRRKDLIVTGGFNVYPREVENAIAELAGVSEVAVIGAPDPKWGELITAFISLQENGAVNPTDIIDHCRTRIAGYKIPKQVRIVDALPKNGNGKIDKASLRAALWVGRDRNV
jgi:long-chain acyl-CoA synthetase